jgi:hypothetical protein
MMYTLFSRRFTALALNLAVHRQKYCSLEVSRSPAAEIHALISEVLEKQAQRLMTIPPASQNSTARQSTGEPPELSITLTIF